MSLFSNVQLSAEGKQKELLHPETAGTTHPSLSTNCIATAGKLLSLFCTYLINTFEEWAGIEKSRA